MSTTLSDRMDPRVEARRNALAAHRTRRRLRIVGVIAAVVLTLGLGVGALFTPLFDVDRVVVRGSGVLSPDAIRRGSGIDRGDPMILVRPGATARRLERLPYVASARVKRVFPGTVRITVRERAASAYAPVDGDRVALLDATGRVLAVQDAPAPPELTRIDGLTRIPAPGKNVEPADLSRVLAELPPGLRSLTAALVWDGNEVTLRLVDDLDVRLGDTANIRAKGAVAEAVIDRSARGTRVVDVRVPTVPVSK